MNISIVIPTHNEERFISLTLQSLVEQTVQPNKVVVVNDNSTDGTQNIVDQFSSKYPFINSVQFNSQAENVPGSKVINAFYAGFETLHDEYDIICKFDADLIFPKNYLESILSSFKNDASYGMAGGFCYIVKNGSPILENLTSKSHIRGALKAYRKECFNEIGGLKKSIGWDTVDELLAQFHGWKIVTDSTLHVIHLKPTGASYSKISKYKQGEAFYKMRYGLILTHIASLKLAIKKKSPIFYLNCIQGYYQAKARNDSYIVSVEEGKFIREFRWKNIKNKFS